jgi:hypothetical protein
MYFVPEGQHDSSQARSAWTGVWTFREGETRRQATPGAERSRAHCIIGVPPVFPIYAKGDDQKLESQTLPGASRRCGAVIPQTRRHRRDAYATFRSASPRAVTSCALAKLDVRDSAQRQRLRIVADILLDPSQLTGTSDNVIERFPVPHRASRISHLVDLFR